MGTFIGFFFWISYFIEKPSFCQFVVSIFCQSLWYMMYFRFLWKSRPISIFLATISQIVMCLYFPFFSTFLLCGTLFRVQSSLLKKRYWCTTYLFFVLKRNNIAVLFRFQVFIGFALRYDYEGTLRKWTVSYGARKNRQEHPVRCLVLNWFKSGLVRRTIHTHVRFVLLPVCCPATLRRTSLHSF